MNSSIQRVCNRLFLPCVAGALLALWPQLSQSQSSCSSDHQTAPRALLERFINADCADCWQDIAAPRARQGQVAIDWIFSGTKGNDAPLSEVANRDGLTRLQALATRAPEKALAITRQVQGPDGVSLRVAHGLVVSGYIGVSMTLSIPAQQTLTQPLSAWLVLAESIPKGLEGTKIPRNLAKNRLQANWEAPEQLSKKEHMTFSETRVMRVAEGAKPDRLRVIGWVEDTDGKVIAAAQSRCAGAPK